MGKRGKSGTGGVSRAIAVEDVSSVWQARYYGAYGDYVRHKRNTNPMSTILHLVYDGKVFHPEEPVALTPATRVRVTIEEVEATAPQPQSFLKTARALRLEGPPDWSTRVKEDLYPEPPDAVE